MNNYGRETNILKIVKKALMINLISLLLSYNKLKEPLISQTANPALVAMKVVNHTK